MAMRYTRQASAWLILALGLNAAAVQAGTPSADGVFDSVSVYAGQGADHNLRELPGLILTGRLGWDKSYFTGLALGKNRGTLGQSFESLQSTPFASFRHGYEVLLVQHRGLQSNAELGAVYMLRTPDLQMEPLGVNFATGAGLSYALGTPSYEDGPKGDTERRYRLQHLVESAVGKVFRSNVSSYASLAAAQPVRVFVGGFVNRPGLYSGTSMDSLLHYLDQAGGIDPDRGSFLAVQVKRGQQVRATANLYDFLLNGTMSLVQLADGDVIFIAPRQNTVKVSGLAANAKRFEFADSARSVADLIQTAKPRATATHVRVVRNTGSVRNTEYYPLLEAAQVALQNGDELEFTSDKKPGTITVRVEGEHLSAQEYVLPYGTRMAELIKNIEFSERSDQASLQLFRQSIKERQKQMLQTSLKSLEVAALTARSGTSDEARLRKEEAELLLQWVDRAKKIEPSGQVVIAHAETRNNLLLENGDVIRVPILDGLVLVSGEVLFPNAIAFDKALSLDDYIRRGGGYTQNADSARIIVARRDGSFTEAGGDKGFFSLGNGNAAVRAGDEILVL